MAPRLDRRDALKRLALGALAFEIGGATLVLTPREARARDVPYTALSADEVALVESLGEAIVPGAREAGLAHYLDHQLAADPAESLLMLPYLGIAPPYQDFYRPALASAGRLSRARFGKPLPALDEEEASALVALIAGGDVGGWEGPPAGLFYFAFRADGIDVVYGTVEGFEALDVPYLPHIAPRRKW